MSIDVEPIVATVRWYDDPKGYEKKLPYKAVATISLLNRDTVFISGMHGSINRQMLSELACWLLAHDIKFVHSFRKGKWKDYSIERYFR